MKIAFTIGAYRLVPFIKLGIQQIRKFRPDAPILVSDDPSQETPHITKLCEEMNVQYRGARTKRGHFAGDFQSMVNALAFGEANGCDLTLKISQRCIFRRPEAIEAIEKAFENPNIMVATPGKPTVHTGSRPSQGFGAFGTLSDLVIWRVGCMTGEQLLHLYRARLMREKVPWASFVECLVDELHSNTFPGRSVKIEEVTNPTPPQDPMFLRRYQIDEKVYRELALKHGWNAQFHLGEWGQLEQGAYLCKPVVV